MKCENCGCEFERNESDIFKINRGFCLDCEFDYIRNQRYKLFKKKFRITQVIVLVPIVLMIIFYIIVATFFN